MPQPLPAKERNLFSQVVKFYESKQNKKGIKAADQILKKVPDHGDTKAMKALILNTQGHQDEAFALAKEALTHDFKSHICWHVYGLLYRSKQNYEESIKAYKNALRWEPESPQIQRDLAMLQAHMRDWAGCVQTRRTMLQARPQTRSNWTCLAVAQQYSGDLEGAEKTLTTYEESLRQQPAKGDIEHQECLVYKNRIIAMSGQTERALEHLNAIQSQISDKQLVMETRAKYLLSLGKHEEALAAFTWLLARNHEDREYYQGYEKASKIDSSNVESRSELYRKLATTYPGADAPLRIPLGFISGDEFRNAAKKYISAKLSRGIPSAFASVKALYSDKSKAQFFQEITEELVANGPVDGERTPQFDESALSFLAQHYNYPLSANYDKAHENINKALSLNEKSVDYLMTKARIYKHQSLFKQAAETMDKARALDKSDRYINTKTGKYQILNDENETALKTLGMFTKPDATGGPLGDLKEMQSVWFLSTDAESYFRQRKFALALKRCHQVFDVFDIWQEDQFDFHAFAFRKGMVNAYTDLVDWEDKLRAHPYFARVALLATMTYMMLYDNPKLANEPGLKTNGVNGNGEHAGKSAKEKAAAKKARKEQEKQAQIEAEKKDAKKTNAVDPEAEPKKVDLDPEGKQLVATKTPLEDAMRFLTPLLELTPNDISTQITAFEIFLRRDKFLPALRALNAIHDLQPSSPMAPIEFMSNIRFRHALAQADGKVDAKVLELLKAESSHLGSGDKATLLKEIDAYQCPTIQHEVKKSRAQVYIEPAQKETMAQHLAGLIDDERTTYSDAVIAFNCVESWGVDGTEFAKKAHAKWPEATMFSRNDLTA